MNLRPFYLSNVWWFIGISQSNWEANKPTDLPLNVTKVSDIFLGSPITRYTNILKEIFDTNVAQQIIYLSIHPPEPKII